MKERRTGCQVDGWHNIGIYHYRSNDGLALMQLIGTSWFLYRIVKDDQVLMGRFLEFQHADRYWQNNRTDRRYAA